MPVTYPLFPNPGSPAVSGSVSLDAAAVSAGFPAPAPKRARLVTLDLMRGYYVGVLAAVHLNYVPSVLGLFDGRGDLLVSEAEGFFMISGLLVGMLRRRDLERHGPLRMTLNSWKRALQLYIVAVPLTLLFTVVGRVAVAHGSGEVKVGLDDTSSPLTVLVHAMELSYTYGWADFLTFYVPMFLAAPLIVWLLSKRLWPLVLLLGYAAFWMPSHYNTVWYSPFLQWSVYFITGAVAGYHWSDLRRLMARLTPGANALVRYGLIAGAVIIYAAGLLLLYRPSLVSSSGLYFHLFENNRLGLLRPLVAPISVAGTYFIVRRFEQPLARTIGKVLVPFGRNSLYVYVAQSFVVFLTPFAFGPQNFLLNTVFNVAVIALLWLGVRTRFLAFLIPKA
jgi:hypothetical protein